MTQSKTVDCMRENARTHISVSKKESTSYKSPAVYCIYGNRAQGKTTLIKNICENIKKNNNMIYENYMIFTPQSNREYYNSSNHFFNEINEKALGKIFGAQLENIKKNGRSEANHIIIIFDDIIFDFRNDYILELFYNSRHYNITFIFTMNHGGKISPQYRTNIDYIFISKCENISIIKQYYEYYGCCCGSFNMFNQIMKCIMDYTWSYLLIDNTNQKFAFYLYESKLIEDIKTNNGTTQELYKKYTNMFNNINKIDNKTHDEPKNKQDKVLNNMMNKIKQMEYEMFNLKRNLNNYKEYLSLISSFELSKDLTNIDFTKGNNYLIYGKRGCGKTVLVNDIYEKIKSNNKNVSYIVFTPNNTGEYDPLYTHEECDDKILDKLIYSQTELIKKNKKRHLTVIFDNYITSNKFMNNKFLNFISNARCLYISVIITLQYPFQLSDNIKSNIDHVFIAHDDNVNNTKKYYDNYGTIISSSFDEFNKIYKKTLLNQFTFLTINNIKRNYVYYKTNVNIIKNNLLNDYELESDYSDNISLDSEIDNINSDIDDFSYF